MKKLPSGERQKESDNLSYWALILSVEFDEPISVKGKSEYELKIKHSATGKTVQIRLPTKDISEIRDIQPWIYDAFGQIKSNPKVDINNSEADTFVTGDREMFESGNVLDRYVIQFKEGGSLIAESDPHPVAIGYPGRHSYDGTEFRFHRHKSIDTNWKMVLRIWEKEPNNSYKHGEMTVDGDDFVATVNKNMSGKNFWPTLFPPRSDYPSLWADVPAKGCVVYAKDFVSTISQPTDRVR